jgi:hypothetical protein
MRDTQAPIAGMRVAKMPSCRRYGFETIMGEVQSASLPAKPVAGICYQTGIQFLLVNLTEEQHVKHQSGFHFAAPT